MKKIVFIYGLISALIISGVSSTLLWTAGDDASHANSVWLGYLVMIIGLSLIFVAVKQHRDNNLGGIINLGKAFQVGFYISLIASVFYVASWELYFQTQGQDFLVLYQNSSVENLRVNGSSEAEIQQAIQDMTEFANQYKNFYFRAFVTLLEILPVGIIVSALCAFLLRTKKS